MKDKTFTAQIRWLSLAEGGRKAVPTGEKYIAPARFGNQTSEWSSSAWNLVVTLNASDSGNREQMATVYFLMPDAPADLLRSGSKFGLFEGFKLVAEGNILNAV